VNGPRADRQGIHHAPLEQEDLPWALGGSSGWRVLVCGIPAVPRRRPGLPGPKVARRGGPRRSLTHRSGQIFILGTRFVPSAAHPRPVVAGTPPSILSADRPAPGGDPPWSRPGLFRVDMAARRSCRPHGDDPVRSAGASPFLDSALEVAERSGRPWPCTGPAPGRAALAVWALTVGPCPAVRRGLPAANRLYFVPQHRCFQLWLVTVLQQPVTGRRSRRCLPSQVQHAATAPPRRGSAGSQVLRW